MLSDSGFCSMLRETLSQILMMIKRSKSVTQASCTICVPSPVLFVAVGTLLNLCLKVTIVSKLIGADTVVLQAEEVIEDWELWGDPREVERRKADRARAAQPLYVRQAQVADINFAAH